MTSADPAPQAFRGTPRDPAGNEGRVAAFVLVLLVVFLVVAVAKPWGAPEPVAPEPSPANAVLPSSSASRGPEVPSAAPVAYRSPVRPFTAPAPPPADARWTGLAWRRLAPDDPLGLVTSVVHWPGGYVATGWKDSPAGPATPVWSSADGVDWTPVPFNTSTTFWPGAIVLAVVGVGDGVAAFTEQAGTSCPVCAPLVPPVVSWTSADGRSWTPHSLPERSVSGPAGTAPLIAGGPGGILVASPGTGHRIALSPDGARWSLLPPATLPSSFVLDDLRATASGYVAGGRWLGAGSGSAAVLVSSDGRSWSSLPSLLPAAPGSGSSRGSTIDTLVVASAGVVAVGHAIGAAATLWWQSSDERSWRPLVAYPPLGAWSPSGAALRAGPHGWLVDDGRRMLAVRGGPDAGAWLSIDGLGWQPLDVSGDVPDEHAAEAVLLPAGVLLLEGSTAWLGEAVTG